MSDGDGQPQRPQNKRSIGLATMGVEGVVIFEVCHKYEGGCCRESILSRHGNAALLGRKRAEPPGQMIIGSEGPI